MKNALVIDYGVGNILSVSSFLSKFGFLVDFSNDINKILDSDLVVLPGVGSFGPAKKKLDSNGASEAILARAQLSRPILGICLGFQLLTRGSEESVGTAGLAIIDAQTKKLKNGPVIGWQQISYSNKKVRSQNSFYFNHSFGIFSETGLSEYSLVGDESYIAYMKQDSIVGVQFHPEKSQEAGADFFSGILDRYWV